uniref:Uncharacterized protein n=1 Tax=Escherichia coli (strain K12 / W3110 / ATCC 27325 / DSM 5911) TaxID=316407 RepID=Q9XB48_ECOW3|nr:hypothetical protein [Escherichia coli str. K-12 substr. W3110]
MHRKCGRSDTLAFANKQWVREYNAQFLNRLTDCRGGQIKSTFAALTIPLCTYTASKIVRRLRSIFRKVVNICGLPSDDFLLKQGSI